MSNKDLGLEEVKLYMNKINKIKCQTNKKKCLYIVFSKCIKTINA